MIVPPLLDNRAIGLEAWNSASSRLKSILPEAEISTENVAAIFTPPKGDGLRLPENDQYRFLVVDDNVIYLRIFKRVLHKLFPTATVDVLQLSTAVDVHSLLQYHIVFLDIEMPDVTGVDIARSVRSCPSLDTVGLIAVTTRHLLSDLQLYQQCGFDHTFPKPVGLNQGNIFEQILRVLENRSSHFC